MEKQIEQVKEFHKAVDAPINLIPTINHVQTEKFKESRYNMAIEEANELKEAIINNDLVEIVDAVADILYVAIGTSIAFGFSDKLPDIFTAVHESNMSKMGADGKPIMRADGKVLKGPNYFTPTEKIKSILEKT